MSGIVLGDGDTKVTETAMYSAITKCVFFKVAYNEQLNSVTSDKRKK